MLCHLLQVPFQGLTIGQVYSRVVHSGARPTLDPFRAAQEQCTEERPALEAYTALLEACWSAEPSSRPRFKQARMLRWHCTAYAANIQSGSTEDAVGQ